MSDRAGPTRRRSTWLVGSVVTGATIVWLFATAASGQTAQPPSGEGAALCLGCHERPGIMEILETPHADLDNPHTPASNEECESCHGPSGTHVNFPMQVGNIRFTKHAKTPVSERNATCLGCHDEGEQAHWATGAHGESLQ